MTLKSLLSIGALLLLGLAAAAPQTAPSSATAVVIHGDTNRDGRLDDTDISGRHAWSWESGPFIMANLDDDDRSGLPDAHDQIVNGRTDEADLAKFRVLIDPSLITGKTEIFVEASGPRRLRPGRWTKRQTSGGGIPVNVFQQSGSDWIFLGPDTPLTHTDAAPIILGVEAKTFAGVGGWDGMLRLWVSVRTGNTTIAEDFAEARVAPWLMLPNSAPTRTLYIATGDYDNSAMIREMSGILPRWGVAFPPPHTVANWREMWVQDTVEIGYTEIPGGGRMHVVLNGIRGADSFGPTLLGPDIGVITVGSVRDLKGHDAWADWFGNLEVSHPTDQFPMGRIYYGINTISGIGLHPEIVAFLEAQVLQKPFWVDTSWLGIKHVDEIFNVIPGKDGRGMVIMGSPEAASALTGRPLDDFNRGIQDNLNRMLRGGAYEIAGKHVEYPGIIALLGMDESRFIRLPVLFSPVSVDKASGRPGAHSRWSNPVNSVFLNGNMLIGNAYMPADVQSEIAAKLRAAGVIEVVFIDDRIYQDRWGNVHCATNTLREPPAGGFWTRMTVRR